MWVSGIVAGHSMNCQGVMQSNRQFQSCLRSSAKLFKQVPDRFEIYFGRKELLAGENE